MLRDWNFWCTVMTSVAAVIAICVSVHQIRLSNKQQLFDRRLKAYMMANSIISLCKENYVFLSEKEKQNLSLLMTSFLYGLQTIHIWRGKQKPSSIP